MTSGDGLPTKGRSDYCTNGTAPWSSPKAMRADVIATSAGMPDDDLDNAPFTGRGGIDGAIRDLGTDAGTYVQQLNAELTA